MAQLVTRVADDLVTQIDELVAQGIVASRSEAVRLGLLSFLDRQRRAAVGAAIVEGYRRRPQREQDVAWADGATRQMIDDEPW